MTLTLGTRVVLGSVLIALYWCLVLVAILVWFPVMGIARFHVRAHEVVTAETWASCRSAPTVFAVRGSQYRIDAYDASTGWSANPSSPPLLLRERLRLQVESEPVFYDPSGLHVVLRDEVAGACSLLYVRTTAHPYERGQFFVSFSLAVAVGIALTGVLVWLGMLAPILRRLRRLHVAAGAAGTPAFRPVADALPDALGALSVVVDDAHKRIVDEAEDRERRRAAMERYLADVAHDLRSPLHAVRLQLEAAHAQQDWSMIHEAQSSLVYADLLTMNLNLRTQLSQDREFASTVCDLGVVVERVSRRFAILGRPRGVTLRSARPDQPVHVEVGGLWLEQVVANLVHNALKAVLDGGNIAVVLDFADDRFDLRIMDDGPGLDADSRAALLEPSPLAMRTHGLGLAIVRAICARADFQLALENTAGGGLTVRIEGAVVVAA